MTVSYSPKNNQTIASASEIHAYRIIFKINTDQFNFKKYDLLPLQPEKHKLFDLDVFICSSFFDLCRVKGQYRQYHEDFIQSYYFRLFDKTQFPIGVFVFVEELTIRNGDFVSAPKKLTINTGNKTNQIKRIRPDYEVYFLESPDLSFKNNSQNMFFLNLTSQYLRGTHLQKGKPFIKNNAFACFHDNYGMTFIVHQAYKGLVANLTSSPNLVPLSLLVGLALGYKHNFLRLNHILSDHLCKVFGNPRRLERRYKQNSRELSNIYNNVFFYLNRTFYINQINIYNRDCYDLLKDIMLKQDVHQYYSKLKEQVEPISVVVSQLNSRAIMKTQGSIRFAIIALGFIILAATVTVSVILGVEPMLRMLNELGLLPANMLR